MPDEEANATGRRDTLRERVASSEEGEGVSRKHGFAESGSCDARHRCADNGRGGEVWEEFSD